MRAHSVPGGAFLLMAAAFLAPAAFTQDDAAWKSALDRAASARQSGNLAEVESLLRNAVQEAEKFGPNDQRVIISLDALGTYYYTQGIYVDAMPVYRRLLAIRENSLGPMHPDVADSLNDLAVVESIMGKHGDAEAHSERALAIVEKSSPGISGVQALAAGGNHACALLEGGSVVCWGSNLVDQFGFKGVARSASPVPVPGLARGVTSIAAGSSHTCALRGDRTVMCWGQNTSGQLGVPPAERTTGPVLVAGITAAKAVAAGAMHTCALLEDSTVKCWGNNQQGQLGNGTTAPSSSPMVVSGLTTAVALAAGAGHTCALIVDGGVSCWGSNSAGQAGKSSAEPVLSAVRVAGLTAPAKALAAGGNHTCALLADGTVACWGRNQSGQLGVPAAPQAAGVVKVSDIAAAKSIAAGYSHTCAALVDDTVKCWGNNQEGQLGDGKAQNSSTPVPVVGLAGVTSIAAGVTHTCAVLSDRTVQCWGTDSYGAPSNVTFSLRSRTPVAVGRDDGAVVTPLSTLAGVYRAAGKFDKAESLYQRALSRGEKVLGPEHPTVRAILNDYAELLRKTGRPDEAAKLDARAQTTPEKPVLVDVPTAPPPR